MNELSQCPSLLKVSVVPEAPCLFVDLRGELDLCSVRDMPWDDYAPRPEITTVLVDLGELTCCDGTGLRALVKFRRIHEAQGRSVVVVRVHPFIRRLMGILGINDRLELTHQGKVSPVPAARLRAS